MACYKEIAVAKARKSVRETEKNDKQKIGKQETVADWLR